MPQFRPRQPPALQPNSFANVAVAQTRKMMVPLHLHLLLLLVLLLVFLRAQHHPP